MKWTTQSYSETLWYIRDERGIIIADALSEKFAKKVCEMREALEVVLSAHGASIKIGRSSKPAPDSVWEKTGEDISRAMKLAKKALS